MKTYSEEEDIIPLGESSDDEESYESDISDIPDDVDIEDSDSDSAPEIFSFSGSNKKVKENEKLTAEVVKQQKLDLKRKRKEILLKNLEQREEKRRKIQSKRLPDHVLQNLDDDFHIDTTGDKLEEQEEEPEKGIDENEEVIRTAGNVMFKCKVLPVEAQKPKFVPEKVAHFKDKMLYGGRIRREKSNRIAVLKNEKQRIKR